jgi:hypothetical protein
MEAPLPLLAPAPQGGVALRRRLCSAAPVWSDHITSEFLCGVITLPLSSCVE